MKALVVLGSVNADHVLQVPSFPRPGETLLGRNYQVIPGGKGANQAVAAARLGEDTGFIACVGDDAFGLEMTERFIADNIDVSGVRIEKGCPTGIAIIQVADSGENSICLSAEANAMLTDEAISESLASIHQAETLLLQLETPLSGIMKAVEEAKREGTMVVLNPAPAQALPDALLAHVDILTPNETEAELLTGVVVSDDHTAQQAADILHAKGISTVLITLGAKGVWCSRRDDAGEGATGTIPESESLNGLIKGFSVTATDTTAAGDTFNGGLVTALLEGRSLGDAIRFAQAAAAISVTRFGAQTSIPTRNEVEAFLKEKA